ncbi:MAG: structural protein [Patescibacteria group bacterium]|nr:structural protein [Patescibacteria group bacterium]
MMVNHDGAIPEGIVLHNPGNIERDGDRVHYDGEVRPSRHPIFKEFINDAFGIRAIIVCLYTYIVEDKIKTLGAVIERWAPPSENDTPAYQAHVNKDCGTTNDTLFTVSWLQIHVRPLVKSIIIEEIGSFPYSDQTLELAISLSGLEDD